MECKLTRYVTGQVSPCLTFSAKRANLLGIPIPQTLRFRRWQLTQTTTAPRTMPGRSTGHHSTGRPCPTPGADAGAVRARSTPLEAVRPCQGAPPHGCQCSTRRMQRPNGAGNKKKRRSGILPGMALFF